MNSEQPPLDHEAIRTTGQVMAEHLGVLAAQSQSVEREPTLERLNECFETVPQPALFEEYDRVGTALAALDKEAAVVTETLRAEVVRLGNLAKTLSTQMPHQAESAKQHAEQKKTEATEAATQQREQLAERRAQLFQEEAEVLTTIESVLGAWPVPPYSDEVLEAAAEARQAMTLNKDGLEEDDFEYGEDEPWAGTPPVIERHAEPEEEIVYGPHAELAERIPSLSDRLKSHESKHAHVYGRVEVAKTVLDRAMEKPQDERTEEEDLLSKAVFVLSRRYLQDPKDQNFLKVYEAKDVIELVQRLNKFSRKNRPDFIDLEEKILDRAATHIRLLGREVPKDIQGAIARMEEGADDRLGMQWRTLEKHANRACDTMRAYLFRGGINTHLKDYAIELIDRSDKKPQLSWVYQFVADDFAFDILGRRHSDTLATTEEHFEQNCEIIQDWLRETRELLEELPEDFRLTRYQGTRVRNFRLNPRRRRAEYENTTAYTTILNMIEDIEIRRAGTGESRAARHKPAKLDPKGALNHQLRLGHRINALKRELAIYDVPTEGHTEEITPFA